MQINFAGMKKLCTVIVTTLLFVQSVFAKSFFDKTRRFSRHSITDELQDIFKEIKLIINPDFQTNARCKAQRIAETESNYKLEACANDLIEYKLKNQGPSAINDFIFQSCTRNKIRIFSNPDQKVACIFEEKATQLGAGGTKKVYAGKMISFSEGKIEIKDAIIGRIKDPAYNLMIQKSIETMRSRYSKQKKPIPGTDFNIHFLNEFKINRGFQNQIGATCQERYQGSLAELKTFSERDLYQISHDLITGLKAIHKQSCVHLDIKPENIFLKTRPIHAQTKDRPNQVSKAIIGDLDGLSCDDPLSSGKEKFIEIKMFNEQGDPRLVPWIQTAYSGATWMLLSAAKQYDRYQLLLTLQELVKKFPAVRRIFSPWLQSGLDANGLDHTDTALSKILELAKTALGVRPSSSKTAPVMNRRDFPSYH